MTNKQLLKEIKKSYQECFEIVEKKNSDYATQEDAFKNFRLFEIVFEGVDLNKCDKTALTIMMRTLDKIQRTAILLGKEASVRDEPIEDSLDDISNYSMLLKVYLKDKGQKNK